jgi:sugar lactone lactonase YvrE
MRILRQGIAPIVALASALTAAAAVPAASASTGAGPITLATFTDPAEHPESVVIGADGTIHVALHAAARLWHRRPDGTTMITDLPRSPDPGAVTRANGIAVGSDGVVSVAVLSTEPDLAGVWQGRPGRAFRRIATLPVAASPNGMSRDRHGNLYVADDALGVIWRVPARRWPGPAEVWLRHALLDRAAGGTPYGANGTEIHDGELWVGNPSQTVLVSVPIKRGGDPGRPRVRLRGAALADVDDFDVERGGAVVAARISAQTIERLRPDGTATVLATAADGLSQPTAVAVDRRGRTAYVTNAAFFRPPGAAPASVQAIPLNP